MTASAEPSTRSARIRSASALTNVPRRRCLLIRPSAARELSAWRTVVRLTP